MVSEHIRAEVKVPFYLPEDDSMGDRDSILKEFCDERSGNILKQLEQLFEEIRSLRDAQTKLLWGVLAGIGAVALNFLAEHITH